MSEYDQVAADMPGEFRVLWRAEVSSTNDELRVLAEQGMGEGLVLIGEEQKAGAGGAGRLGFLRRVVGWRSLYCYARLRTRGFGIGCRWWLGWRLLRRWRNLEWWLR